MTDPTGPHDGDERPDENPTEETMTTPTTSSPPEGDFFTQMGGPTQTEAPNSEPTGDDTAGETTDAPTMTYAGPQQPAPPKGPRMRSIAWGLVLALLGAVVIAVGLGVRLDLQLVFIGILAVAGLTLLVGSLVSGSRKDGSQ